MKNLIKIHDVSARYDITARTLRYYEDIGLIKSVRSDDYAYRLYDETSIKKLEQILILRKLNISVKDIQRIFNAQGSDTVLEVLGKKVRNIDDDVALLYELRQIVLDFIHEIESMDFGNETDIKLLYDRAKDIEARLTKVDYIGKPSNIGRFIELTEQLDKKHDVRIIEIPECKMVSSGVGMFGENNIDNFAKWLSTLPRSVYPRDYLFWDGPEYGVSGGFHWLCIYEAGMDVPVEYGVINFKGGLYAVTTDIDQRTDTKAMGTAVDEFLKANGFERDYSRPELGNIITTPFVHEVMGYDQMDYYTPIQRQNKSERVE